MTESKIRSYTELITYATFEDRFNYLRLYGKVGEDTFGFDRIFNQEFYRSKEWRSVRDYVITRDLCHDMGLMHPDYEISSRPVVHHMNPINLSDIQNTSDFLLNPEYLICVSYETHNAIHYGFATPNDRHKIIKRFPNDTCPWKR